ncbi:MAG: hypothetical protein JNL11_10250 [Bdellovibrionaceae bacterium]|nr:hypothetical protein [Pseudobdellovibrionaceae bacterium]
MKVKILLQGILLTTCMSMLSCGGDGRKPLDTQSGSLVLSQFKTQMAGIPTSNTTPTMVGASMGLGGVSMSSFGAKAMSCQTLTPNPTKDADQDGIAAEIVNTYDCTDTASGGSTYTMKGTVKFVDLDETVKGVYGGMRGEFNIPTITVTSGGFSFNYSHVGFWEYKNVDGALKSTSEYTGGMAAEEHGMKLDYKYSQKWAYTMTPADKSKPFDAGTLDMTGSFSMTGDFVIEDSSGKHQPYNGTWVISYNTKDLTYDRTCSQHYKTGSFIMSDSMNTMELKYECTKATLYVNGVESDWWK